MNLKFYYCRGATAYEFQWWRFYVRYCHLTGEYWSRAWFWQKFDFHWLDKNGDVQ